MSVLDNEYYDIKDFANLLRETTLNLKEMNHMQFQMRWQFDDKYGWEEFVSAMEEAQGWISSHC